MPMFMILGDADGIWARELCHSIEQTQPNGASGRLRVDSLSTEARASERIRQHIALSTSELR
ncbi:hypothetical protein WJ64_32640 [Burkholderia ubonensis]|nr:hypothetical protein WJ64_32640 [Burkholderia ubonensis]